MEDICQSGGGVISSCSVAFEKKHTVPSWKMSKNENQISFGERC